MHAVSAVVVEPPPAAGAAAKPQLRVIATTEPGTRAALLEAKRLATHLDMQEVVVLVPQVASSLATLESPDDDAVTVERFRRIARGTGVDATINLCVCGALREMFRWMLPHGCLVILGGHRRWWWPTREQRIADLLKQTGHRIVFADASRADLSG